MYAATITRTVVVTYSKTATTTNLGIQSARIVTGISIVSSDGKDPIAVFDQNSSSPDSLASDLEGHSDRSWWKAAKIPVDESALLKVTFADRNQLKMPPRA